MLGEGTRIIEDGFEKVNESVSVPISHRDNEGQYDIVCVGMAPAREELREGRPFVGVSGQILRKTLTQMGVNEFYLTNILRCSIEEGEDSLAYECAGYCFDRLILEIMGRQPKLVIALGDLPLKILAPDIPLTIKQCEGRILPSKVGALLPITHPAYYWRNPYNFFDFPECLRSGIKFLSGSYTQAVEPKWELVTHENISRIKCEIDKYEEIGIDTETTGLSAYGWDPDEIMELGIAVSPEQAYIIPKPLIKEFKELLESKKGVFWNAQFDAAMLRQEGITCNIDFDGMLAHYSIDERAGGHGLKRVARIYLGADNWDEPLAEFFPKRKKLKAGEEDEEISYAKVPKQVLWPYLAKDCTRTLQLRGVLEEDLNKKIFNELLMPSCRMFSEVQHHGVRMDPYALVNLQPKLEQDIWKLEVELHDLIGYWINANSPPQVKRLLYEEMEYPPDPFFGMSTGKEALEAWKGDPIVDRILEVRQLSKLKGTYVEGFIRYLDRNYHIHPEINLHKSKTGRLSSDKPSIMNIKRDSTLKEIFLPEEGKVMLYGDIKGNEISWYAIIGNDLYLQDLLRKRYEMVQAGAPKDEINKFDIHYLVTMQAYGEHTEEKRTIAKAGVFGKIYKRTRASMAKTFGEDVVDTLIATIDSMIPNIPNYYKAIDKQVKQGYIESWFGRRRHFGLVTPDIRKYVDREAVNYPIQSSGSDLMLYSFLHLWEIKDKYGIYPYWPIHDSITMDGEDPKVLPLIQKELEDYAFNLVEGIIPFQWDMKWGHNWKLEAEED